MIAAIRFTLARGQRGQRPAEPVDLAEEILDAGLDVAAYLVKHWAGRSLR